MEISHLPSLALADLPALTNAQAQRLERMLVEDYSLTLAQIMENAGHNLADLAALMLGSVKGKVIHVLAGRGNNGAGGLVAARHLHNRGARVAVWTAWPKNDYDGTPLLEYEIVEHIGLPLTLVERGQVPSLPPADLILDAIIGTGLRGDPRGASRDMILAILGQDTLILSLECPSGLDTGEGKVFAPCVLATCTLILGLPKTGLLPESARPAVGQMFLADVSVPPAAYARLGLEDLPLLFDRGGLARLV